MCYVYMDIYNYIYCIQNSVLVTTDLSPEQKNRIQVTEVSGAVTVPTVPMLRHLVTVLIGRVEWSPYGITHRSYGISME